MITQANKYALEAMIDSNTLAEVVAALSEICAEKADHIRANWQDAVTAQAWDIAADKLGRVCRIRL